MRFLPIMFSVKSSTVNGQKTHPEIKPKEPYLHQEDQLTQQGQGFKNKNKRTGKERKIKSKNFVSNLRTHIHSCAHRIQYRLYISAVHQNINNDQEKTVHSCLVFTAGISISHTMLGANNVLGNQLLSTRYD